MILKPGFRWGNVTGKVSFTPGQALEELNFIMHPDALGVIFRGYSYLDDNLRKRRGTFVSNFFPPSNPQTPPQQHRRGIFAGAVARWHTLSPEQKKEWNQKARGKPLSGFNSFLSEALRSA